MANPSRVLLGFPARLLLVGVAVAALGTGCSSGPKTHPLRGKVVYKSGQPVGGGSIAFESTTGDPPWRAGAELRSDGTFDEVSTLGLKGEVIAGIVEGEHRVKIDLGRGGEDGTSRLPVPARYLDFEKSGITIKVPAPNNEVTIELDLK
ncbi:MAG TPA: hypothetical protein VKD90_21145 [Gemmataceae bacterium]|nr:hypothetical protein [Gemmataceae bacterium]